MNPQGDHDRTAMGRLTRRYKRVNARHRVGRQPGYRFRRLLGLGGQGRVYLTHYGGSDGFGYDVALKVYSPEPYLDVPSYEDAMRRMARVASLVAGGNHPNLMGVRRFEQYEGIRVMLMEYLVGFDLRRLISARRHQRLQKQVTEELWQEINRVVVTAADHHLRLTPGIAVNIIRDCLHGLDWLHRQGIVHGDIKPANVMLCRAGEAKIIDFGSAFERHARPRQRVFTRSYAAPEVLRHQPCTPQSDLASLGYVLIELLAGRRLFDRQATSDELIRQKEELPSRLRDLLPAGAAESEVLMHLCRGLVAPDPALRFESAERAHLDPARGAHQFLQELVLGRLGTAFAHHLARWVQAKLTLDDV